MAAESDDTFTADKSSWVGRSIISVKQFASTDALSMLLEEAKACQAAVEKDGGLEVMRGKLLANVFYEPSTRTSCSFAAAAMRLGGNVVPVSGSSSSVAKGESLEDTVRTMACYCDAIVLRHPSVGAAARAAACSPVPVLNAGDGAGEHPTQALLDLVTIACERGTAGAEGLRVTMLGDLRHGRTVHSLARLLALYTGVSFTLVAPEGLGMPEEVVHDVQAAGRDVRQVAGLSDEVLAATDVLYVTRVQKERFASAEEYEAAKGSYVVDGSALTHLPADAIIMHPLPRVDEIHTEVDGDSRAAYFRQMRYGMFTRMALLRLLLGV